MECSTKKYTINCDDLKTLFNSSIDIMIIADECGTILYVNERIVDILGYSVDEMLGNNFHKYIHPEDISSTINIEEKLQDDNKTQNKVRNFTNRYLHKAGNYIHLTWKSTFNNEKKKYYAIASDDKNLDIFLSKVTHELRTPMNAIIGYIQLMMLDDTISAENISYLNDMLNNSQLLMSIIDDLLEVADLSIATTYFNVCVNKIIVFCIDQIREDLKNKKIKLVFDQKDSYNFISINEKKLIQLISNLLSNAVKYNKMGGTIEIWCNVDEEHKKISINVKDTGIGIKKEDIEKLYVPFERLGKTEYAGHGLGLSIVHGIVHTSKGTIKCESELGEWTQFTVSFGLGDNKYCDKISDDKIMVDYLSPEAEKKKIKILYVEDNKYNSDLVSKILKKKYNENVHLDIAETGELGLQKLKNTMYDLILLDYLLPDFNGDIVLKKAIEYGYIVDTKNIILSTSYVDPLLTKKISNIGISKFLFKPISVKELYSYTDDLFSTK